jgi:hypothetical protein
MTRGVFRSVPAIRPNDRLLEIEHRRQIDLAGRGQGRGQARVAVSIERLRSVDEVEVADDDHQRLLISWLTAAASVATERRTSGGPPAVICESPSVSMLLTLIGGDAARPLDLGPVSDRGTAT